MMDELRSQQERLIKRRNELIDCWFLPLRRKRVMELKSIEIKLDMIELEMYNNSAYKKDYDILIHECNMFIDKMKRYRND